MTKEITENNCYFNRRDIQMISENIGNSLHDKATQGEILSNEEQTLLNEWYIMQDKIESELLGLDSVKSESNIQLLRLVKEQQDLLKEQRDLLRLFFNNKK